MAALWPLEVGVILRKERVERAYLLKAGVKMDNEQMNK